jgi:predicted nucleotidyltransferase
VYNYNSYPIGAINKKSSCPIISRRFKIKAEFMDKQRFQQIVNLTTNNDALFYRYMYDIRKAMYRDQLVIEDYTPENFKNLTFFQRVILEGVIESVCTNLKRPIPKGFSEDKLPKLWSCPDKCESEEKGLLAINPFKEKDEVLFKRNILERDYNVKCQRNNGKTFDSSKLSERFNEALQYSLDRLKKRPDVKEVWLYGSVADFSHNYYSDIDLFVWVEPMTPRRMRALINSVSPAEISIPEVDINTSTRHFKTQNDMYSLELQKKAIRII